MTTAMTFSDEELTAYLDGELEPARRAEIDAVLGTDDALSERLAGLTLPMGALRAAMAPGVIDAPALPSALQITHVQTRPRRLWIPAAVAAAFTLGFGLNTLFQPAEPSGWTTAVASYQALYITDTLSGPVQENHRRDEVLAWANQVFDVDLTPALDVDGMDFKRAQVLGFRNKPLLQIAYLKPDGTPMALCLIPTDGPDKAPETSVLFDLAGVSWVENGVGYYLVGGEDLSTVSALTSRIRAAI